MDADYMRRFEEANRQFNEYIKATTRAILTFSRSLSSFFPYCRIVLSRKEYSYILKKQGFKKYEITEKLFPKKKKRGSMRRARRDKEFAKFFGTLPDDVYIDEWDYKNDPHQVSNVEYDNSSIELAMSSHSLASQDMRVGYRRTTNQIFDDFDQPEIPPISREEFMQKASFSAPWPGPFEGEEES